jgi:hypothetical protein
VRQLARAGRRALDVRQAADLVDHCVAERHEQHGRQRHAVVLGDQQAGLTGRAERRPQALVVVHGVGSKALTPRGGLDDRLQQRQVLGVPGSYGDAVFARLPDAAAGRGPQPSEDRVLVAVRPDVHHHARHRRGMESARDQTARLQQRREVRSVDRWLDLHDRDPVPPCVVAQRGQHGVDELRVPGREHGTARHVPHPAEYGYAPRQELAARHQLAGAAQQDVARLPAGAGFDVGPTARLEVVAPGCGGHPRVPLRVRRRVVDLDLQH